VPLRQYRTLPLGDPPKADLRRSVPSGTRKDIVGAPPRAPTKDTLVVGGCPTSLGVRFCVYKIAHFVGAHGMCPSPV